jgi:glycosyltransferase involved in cell wall biosynthesis
MKIRLIYLGSRGGGAEIFRELRLASGELEEIEDFQFVRSDGLELSGTDFQISSSDIVLPGLQTVCNKPWYILKFILGIVKLIKNGKNATNIFLMPSPLDYFAFNLFKFNKQKCIFLIHDAIPHPGEKWPKKSSIHWRLDKADGLVFFSDFVFQKVKARMGTNNYKVVSHPPFSIFTKYSGESIIKRVHSCSNRPIMLFVGRIRKYKGLEILAEHKKQIQEKFQLVIAGEGTLPDGLEGVETINHWLTEIEIRDLISQADIMIFPYTEASQSGVIPSAIALGKRLIVSEVGGLTEQIENYSKALTFNPDRPETLLVALERSLRELNEVDPFRKYDDQNDQTTFSRLLSQILEVSQH